MLTITDTAIRDLFDNGAYDRGTTYSKQGRVGKLNITNNPQIDSSIPLDIMLDAKVQGSGRSRYQVEANVWLILVASYL